ncbi:MAG: EAL domain-containing protein [Micromonosporaceae bacterium]
MGPALSVRGIWAQRGYALMRTHLVPFAFCGWMLALGMTYFGWPSAQLWTGTLIGLSGAAALTYGVARFWPTRPAPWWLLAAALATETVTRTLYDVLPGPGGTVKAGMLLVDLLYMSMFALFIAALMAFARRDRSCADWTAVLDAAIFLFGVGLLAWLLLVTPLGATDAARRADALVATRYPLGDVLLLGAVAYFVVVIRRTISAALIVIGGVVLAINDTVFVLGYLDGHWLRGTPADIWWMVAYTVTGLAGLIPSMRAVSAAPLARLQETSSARLIVLAIAALVPPTILLVETMHEALAPGSWLVITSAGMILLVFARLTSAVYRLRQQSAREHRLREATADLVSAADVREVEAALDTAVQRLLPAGAWYRLVLNSTDGDRSGLVDSGWHTSNVPGDRMAEEAVHTLDTPGVVSTARLPKTLAARLRPARRALAYPLVKQAPGPAVPTGLLVVGADDASLALLRVPMATLAGSATLALDRVRLNREVIANASERYFRALVHNTADVIFVLDDNDRVRYASPSAATIFGDRDLRGLVLPDLVDNQDEARRLLSRSLGQTGDSDSSAGRARVARDWSVHTGSGQPALVDVSYRDLRTDPSVRGRVVTLRDVTEQRRLERELTQQALHDPLTGLPNRVLFLRQVAQAVSAAASRGTTTGVLLLDLDEFKLINDTLGHDAGDAYLVDVGQRMLKAGSPHSVAARLGGDEFAVLMTDSSDAAVAGVAASLIEALSQPIRVAGQLVTCGVSVGVATTTNQIASQELMHQADLALYAAKQAGKGCWRHYESSMYTNTLRRLELRSSLERALAEGELSIEYQPIVTVVDGEVVGYEALLRWRHPTRGCLASAEFIEVAEDSGLIVPIGEWVLRRAVSAAANWAAASDPAPYVSVNISTRQFQAAGFVGGVRDVLATANLPANRLMLEVTESLLLREGDRVRQELGQLRQMGVRIAIDDFGTGYSALSHLRLMPLDMIKIDRSVIAAITTSNQQRVLFDGIVNLAHTLGLAVVAEGIETAAERDLARRAGCAYGQGYFYAHPMPEPAMPGRVSG